MFTQNSVLFLFRTLWKCSTGNRHNILLYIFLFLVANMLYFLEPIVIGRLLNIIQEFGLTSESMKTIVIQLLILLGLDVGFWLFHGPARIIENQVAFVARNNFKEYLLSGTMDLPASWHTDHHSGDTIDKINKASDSLYTFSSHLFEVIQVIVRFVSSFVALVYFNIHAGYIIVIMLLITITMIKQYDKRLVREWSSLFKKENQISAKIFDVISNITTVIILSIEKLVLKSIVKKMKEPFTLYKKNIRTNEFKWFFVSMCTSVTMVLILFSYIYGAYMAGSVILVGTIYTLYGYVSRINDVFFRCADLLNNIMREKTAVQNAESISKEFIETTDIAQVDITHWQNIKIQHLTFSYHTKKGTELHLDDISVSISHGEKIALIGDSGSGKTTFLKVLRGLYTPKRAEIILDGTVIPDGLHALSDAIALIPQDPEIFATTIEENITIGIPHPLEYIDRFAQMAQFSDIVKKLPKGYKSSIVEKGVNLSGGQKQRLALTRGLLASVDKSILLFDEPTSSVDTKNEAIIYRNIFDVFKDKTIFSSIHRLHLLNLFDRIIVFRDGKIVADGTLRELREHSEEFQHLWEAYQKAAAQDPNY